jgi:hypothetical protein
MGIRTLLRIQPGGKGSARAGVRVLNTLGGSWAERLRPARMIWAGGDESGADDDHLVPADDLTCGADRVPELVASASVHPQEYGLPLILGRIPLMGDTSCISMESRSRPVRTRCRPSTSPCPTSDSHQSTVTHARQQSIELIVATVDRAGQELADTGLANAAEARQLRGSSPRPAAASGLSRYRRS